MTKLASLAKRGPTCTPLDNDSISPDVHTISAVVSFAKFDFDFFT